MLLPKFVTHYKPLSADRFAWAKTRNAFFSAVIIVLLTLFHFYYAHRYAEGPTLAHGELHWQEYPSPPTPAVLPPPLYSEFHYAQLQLPHQDWSKTKPSENERFFLAASHAYGMSLPRLRRGSLISRR